MLLQNVMTMKMHDNNVHRWWQYLFVENINLLYFMLIILSNQRKSNI